MLQTSNLVQSLTFPFSFHFWCHKAPSIKFIRVGSSPDPWLEPVRVVNRGNGADKAEKKKEKKGGEGKGLDYERELKLRSALKTLETG